MSDTLLAGRYRLLEAIGKGTSATVWRALDEQLGLTVAVKIMHPQFSADASRVERFEREARALAALGDPSIIKVYDFGRDEKTYFIVEELVNGRTLAARLAEDGALSEEACRRIGAAIAHALSVSHAAGIVHRDVKPQNVLITDDGRVCVTDFGIARAMSQSALTQTGTVLGTAKYISPEQARGAGADERSDIYALGAVLYEMGTGAPPFAGDDALAVAEQHVMDEPVPARELRPELSEAYERIVMKCLAKDASNRFATCAEVVAALEGGLVAAAPALPRERRRRPLVGKPPSWVAAAVLAALLLVVGAAIGNSLVPRPAADPGTYTAEPIPVIPAPPGLVVVRPLSVRDYDPQGDGQESPGEVANTVDNDASTFWATDRYNSETLGNLKQGVGLVYDFGRGVPLKRCTVVVIGQGIDAQIKGSNDLATWTTLATKTGLAPRTDFELPGTRFRYALLWITKLSQDPDGYRARIAEVSFARRPG
jgi:tRNA A-37 threonylcarbamoyl transferase component Bud32